MWHRRLFDNVHLLIRSHQLLDAPAIQVDRRAVWREPSLQRKRAAFEHSK